MPIPPAIVAGLDKVQASQDDADAAVAASEASQAALTSAQAVAASDAATVVTSQQQLAADLEVLHRLLDETYGTAGDTPATLLKALVESRRPAAKVPPAGGPRPTP